MKMIDLYHRAKLATLILLGVLLLVITFQNLESIQVRLLFSTFTLPKAILIIATSLLGFALGYISCTLRRVRAKRLKMKEAAESV